MEMRTRSVLLGLACLLVAASFAQATTLFVDRGLPSTGVYATSAGGGTDWSQRTNIGSGDYDPQDPIWVNDNYGPPELSGDTFVMSTTAYVTDIRVWLDPNNGASSYAAAFSAMSLMLGQVTPNPSFTPSYQPSGAWNGGSFPASGPLPLLSSNLAKLTGAPTETDVTFPGTSYKLWQLDFPVNQVLTGGTSYGFAIDPTGNPCNNASGNGESYYIAFLDCTMQGHSSGYPNDGSDGFVQDYFTDGTLCDQYVSPWGGVQPFDASVQVLGDPVPEPITMTLVGMGIFGLGGYIRRRVKVAQ
jgi:hypothetical protein